MTAIFDLDGALERVDGDRSLLCELAGIYLDEAASLETAITRALDQNDVGSAKRAAHTLKGACANFCCSELHEAAWAFEQMPASNPPEEVTIVYENLMRESKRLRQALQEVFSL
jgi:HPt (histidine-containing phosphotransfer) domain-containing protein